jgi:hypothetical protein
MAKMWGGAVPLSPLAARRFAARAARPKLSRGARPQKFASGTRVTGHCADVLDRQDVQGRSEAASRIATTTGKLRIMHPCVLSSDFGSWKMFESPVPDGGGVVRSPGPGNQMAKAPGADELAGASSASAECCS